MRKSYKASILYFDDEDSCLSVFREFFGDDYDVQTVSTLVEARRALANGRFDIVISDQLMPEIDGLTFLRSVAATHPESYRIMMTGTIGVGQVIYEVSAGIIHHFVAKPWTVTNMRGALDRGSIPKVHLTRERRTISASPTYNAA